MENPPFKKGKRQVQDSLLHNKGKKVIIKRYESAVKQLDSVLNDSFGTIKF